MLQEKKRAPSHLSVKHHFFSVFPQAELSYRQCVRYIEEETLSGI